MSIKYKEWEKGKNYDKNKVVIYNGIQYVAVRDVRGAHYSPDRSENWSRKTPQETEESVNTMSTEAKIWKKGEAYKKGETVFYENCQYVVKRDILSASTTPNLSNAWAYVEPKWEVTNSTVEKQLLTEICLAIFVRNDYTASTWECKLQDWWEHNKLKLERELKLEKIQSIICQNKTLTVEQQAEEILKLLGE